MKELYPFDLEQMDKEAYKKVQPAYEAVYTAESSGSEKA